MPEMGVDYSSNRRMLPRNFLSPSVRNRPLVRINYMNHFPSNEERLPDDLQEVADMLCDGRPRLDPLTLDAIKLRALSGGRRTTSHRQKGSLMRPRLSAFLTAAFLALGTGGALALSGGGGGALVGASASKHQYRPPQPCPPGYREVDHHCVKEEGHKHK
jgi:hypothetical protein